MFEVLIAATFIISFASIALTISTNRILAKTAELNAKNRPGGYRDH